jgi:hypothetical protein
MNIKQLGAAAVIGGLAFGYSQYDAANKYAALAKEYQLTEGQADVMRECNASLSRHSRKFKEDIDQKRGCACVAQRMTKELPPAQYSAANDVIDLLIENSKSNTSGGKILEQLKQKPTVARLEMTQQFQLVIAANTSIGFCGKAANLARRAIAHVKVPDFVTPQTGNNLGMSHFRGAIT